MNSRFDCICIIILLVSHLGVSLRSGRCQDNQTKNNVHERDLEIAELSKAIIERPHKVESYLERAQLYWSEGKRDLADSDLQAARRLDLYLSQVTQAELWNVSGERQKAYDLLSAAILSKPTRHEAYVARSFTAKENEAALSDLSKGMSLFQDKKSHAYYVCLYSRAEMLFDLGRYAESIQDVNAAIEWNDSTIAAYAASGLKFPQNPRLFYLRGLARFKIEQYNEAISDFSTSEAVGGRWSDLFSARADCYQKLGDKVKEREDRELAMRMRLKE